MENKGKVESVDKKSILQKDLNLKEILIITGIFGIVITYIGVFLLPKYNEYKNTAAQLKEIEQNITNYESEISTLSILKKQLSSVENEIENERKKLSYNMEDGMFLVGLSNLINSLDVDLVSYTVDDTIPYSNFYAIPTTIEVRGNYNYIRRIMSYLEEQKNTTQILDYSMETYIDEDDTQQTENQYSTEIVSDSVVYWTENGSEYHKKECDVLKEEQSNSLSEILSGTAIESGKSKACEECKPYITVLASTQQVEDTEPKATGEIVAKFKFIMYSTENPKYGLGIEDYNDWQPGKYNPFTTTTR